MALISFKDVGVKSVDKLNDVLSRSRTVLPIGVKTPLELGDDSGALFKLHFSAADQISDNIRNLLLTNYGERLGLTTFGANLRPLVTEYRNKEDFDSEAMARIKQALQTWMPFVVPTGFDSEPQFTENQFTGRIKLVVVYSAPALGLVDSVLEMELFVI